MHRSTSAGRVLVRTVAAGVALAVLVVAGGANAGAEVSPELEAMAQPARIIARRASAWYRATPPTERIIWGGLIACAGLGLGVLGERMIGLRRRRIIPSDFKARFLDRLREGKLDRGKALDFCELNPSPAARVALAAVRRWGRGVGDLERGVALANRVEADRLQRNVGTLRRIAALTPLLGLLGTLVSAGRVLAAQGASARPSAWAPPLGAALSPLTAGVALAILALIAYDGLVGYIESLAGALDRLAAETVDSIALATPPEPRSNELRLGAAGPVRTPHQLRVEIPEPGARPGGDRDSQFD